MAGDDGRVECLERRRRGRKHRQIPHDCRHDEGQDAPRTQSSMRAAFEPTIGRILANERRARVFADAAASIAAAGGRQRNRQIGEGILRFGLRWFPLQGLDGETVDLL